jgi:hypothetical protein
MSATCRVCGRSLAGRRAKTKTCSDRCRQALHRSRSKAGTAPAPVPDGAGVLVTLTGSPVTVREAADDGSNHPRAA